MSGERERQCLRCGNVQKAEIHGKATRYKLVRCQKCGSRNFIKPGEKR